MLELLFRTLRYLRLKVSVSWVRFWMWQKRGVPKTLPSAVIQIPSRDAGRTIKTHVYQPDIRKAPASVLVNFHGSGFVFPMHGSDDEWCTAVSRNTGHVVLDVQYRLAPENPWPAAPEDAEDVVDWVLGQPEVYNAKRISVSGFSAGGCLALVQAGVTFPKDTFYSVIAFYPPTNMALDPAHRVSSAPDKTGHQIPLAMEYLFTDSYLFPDTDARDPRVSPYFAATEKFPYNVMVLTAACDNLCMEGEALAARIAAAGDRNVVRRRFEGCNHAWDKGYSPGSVAEAAKIEAYEMAMNMLSLSD